MTVLQQSNRAHDGVEGSEHLVVLHHGETLDDCASCQWRRAGPDPRHRDRLWAKRGEQPVAEGRRLKLLMASADGKSSAQIVRISVYADENLETTVALEDSGAYVQVSRVDPNPKLKPKRPKDDADDPYADEGGMRLYQSLYETALKQNIPSPSSAISSGSSPTTVDFQRAVAAGDTFDAFYSNGDEEGHDDLLYASITVRDDVYRYYRFQDPADGTGGFLRRKWPLDTQIPDPKLSRWAK